METNYILVYNCELYQTVHANHTSLRLRSKDPAASLSTLFYIKPWKTQRANALQPGPAKSQSHQMTTCQSKYKAMAHILDLWPGNLPGPYSAASKLRPWKNHIKHVRVLLPQL